MTESRKLSFSILPDSEDVIYDQRETGVTHTPFQLEYQLYLAIKNGEEAQVSEAIDHYLRSGLVIGRLSDNTLRQIQYWAVACISVSIHYAILGGLDETDAFNLSDIYIRHVNEMKTLEECIDYLRKKALELTERVRKSREKRISSPIVRHCLHYIHIHLHERLKIEDLAEEVGVTRDYLSAIFKKETGESLHAYILREKLESSKELLLRNVGYDEISYNYAFCSQAHYISCFKRQFGMTPGEYKRCH